MTNEKYLERLALTVGLRKNGYYDEARSVATDLVKVRPQESSIWHTLGQIWTDIGEFDSALECHETSFHLMQVKGNANVSQIQTGSLGLAVARLRLGRFAATWPLWEAGRLNVSWFPWPGSKYWDGSVPLHPESLLIQCEGGYGDQFMMMRWLPLLKSRLGAGRVGLMIWPAQKGFCDWLQYGVDEVFVIGEDTMPFGQYKYAASMLSMPALFGLGSWDEIPKSGLAPERVWKNDPCQPVRRIGFCWRAEENTSPVRTKSLPVEVAENICTNATYGAVKFYSLSPQKADLYNTVEFQEPENLIVEPGRMTDWSSTAFYMCSMDFILTVDTGVAHLAGLLGIPTLVLLPRSSCWRWRTADYDYGPWYGNQLTYYRQPVALKWDAEEIVKALIKRIE